MAPASISEFDVASGDDEIFSTWNLGISNEDDIGELLNAKAPATATTPATASAPATAPTTAPDTDIGELLNAKSPGTTRAPATASAPDTASAKAPATAPDTDIGELLNGKPLATALPTDIEELLNAKAPATATALATASAPATAPATHTVPASPLSTYLNLTGFNTDAPSSLTDLSEHFLNDLLNIDSQTSTSSTSSSWSPGPASVLPNSSSLTPSSPRKRTNSSNCGGPETKQRRLSSESESAPGGSKPNTNKKENDRLIAENDAMMKLRKKDILDMWTMIKMQDVWLACKRGLEFDSVRSNFSEFLVSDFSYRKIMADEQDAEHKASELEAFRKDRKNRDKRKDVIMRQKDVIKGQEEVLRQLKSLSQDLDIRV